MGMGGLIGEFNRFGISSNNNKSSSSNNGNPFKFWWIEKKIVFKKIWFIFDYL